MSGFIHDVTPLLDRHPGGRALLMLHIGKDATAAFNGGVYDHSNAAHNVKSLRFSVCRIILIHAGIATGHDACRSIAWRRRTYPRDYTSGKASDS